MMTGKRRKTVTGGLIALFTMLTVWGIAQDEVAEIVINATIICFSCIGIK